LNEARIIRDTYTDDDIDEIVEGATAEDVTVARRDFVKKKAHVGHNSGNNEWYTPPEFIEAARRVFRQTTNPCECDGDGCCCIDIELDPATSETAQRIVKAAAYYTAEHDGLAHRWHGTVWLNPPYSQPLIGQFINKLVGHINGNDVPQAIVLVNNGTDTAWGQMLLDNASAVCFPSRRIKFHDANGSPTGAPLQGQMIVHLESPQERAEAAVEEVQASTQFELEFSDFGVVLKR
jgi:ParB family chromosome partitioning protein